MGSTGDANIVSAQVSALRSFQERDRAERDRTRREVDVPRRPEPEDRPSPRAQWDEVRGRWIEWDEAHDRWVDLDADPDAPPAGTSDGDPS